MKPIKNKVLAARFMSPRKDPEIAKFFGFIPATSTRPARHVSPKIFSATQSNLSSTMSTMRSPKSKSYCFVNVNQHSIGKFHRQQPTYLTRSQLNISCVSTCLLQIQDVGSELPALHSLLHSHKFVHLALDQKLKFHS